MRRRLEREVSFCENVRVSGSLSVGLLRLFAAVAHRCVRFPKTGLVSSIAVKNSIDNTLIKGHTRIWRVSIPRNSPLEIRLDFIFCRPRHKLSCVERCTICTSAWILHIVYHLNEQQILPGTQSKPIFPLNLLADFAGGGLMCALGILLALFQRASTGRGQVVDVDMVSGTRYVASFPLAHALVPGSPLIGVGDSRGSRLLDGGAPFYGVYTCKDGRWISVGCLEHQFYATFTEKFIGGLPREFMDKKREWRSTMDAREDSSRWPHLRTLLEEGFKTRTRDEWAEIFHGIHQIVFPLEMNIFSDRKLFRVRCMCRSSSVSEGSSKAGGCGRSFASSEIKHRFFGNADAY